MTNIEQIVKNVISVEKEETEMICSYVNFLVYSKWL